MLQWNLSVKDNLGPAILFSIVLNRGGFLFSEVNGVRILVLNTGGPLSEVPLYASSCVNCGGYIYSNTTRKEVVLARLHDLQH